MAEQIKLTREEYAELLQRERELHDLLPEFDKADECGIDCQLWRQERLDLLARIEAVKKHYAPTGR